jgi:hypothetical protein
VLSSNGIQSSALKSVSLKINPAHAFMNRIQFFLSLRWIGILFTILSIIASNSWQQILKNFDVDNTYCIAAAKNISEGHGYSIKMASDVDYSKFYYKPLERWPPGHSWLLCLIHKIFSKDWILTTYMLNALGLTVLVLLFRKMLFQLEFPVWIINPTVLFFGFFEFTFHYSNNSDLLGLVFYLAGISVLLSFVKSGKNILGMIFLAGFLLGSSAYMKFLYVPLAFVPFFSLLIYGYFINRKDLRSAALKGLISLFLIVLSLLLFQFLNSGKPLFINPSKTGFFPFQLLELAPVIPASLLNLNFTDIQISIYSPFRYESMKIFWSVVNIVCITWLFYACYKLWRRKILMIRDFRSFYFIHVILFTLSLFGYLSLLTLTKNKTYSDTYFSWVYAGEIRYYAVFSIFLIQFVIYIFQRPEFFFNKTGKRIFRWLIIFIMMEEIGHGTYYCIKQVVINKEYGSRVGADQIYFKTMAISASESAQTRNVVFCSNAQKISNMAAIEGLPVIYELGKLRSPLPASQPLTLIIAIDKNVPDPVVPLFLSHIPNPDYVIDSVKFYIVNIPKSPGY